MQQNLKDILSNLSPDVDQEALLQYLKGQLSAEQQHELEKEMLKSDFSSDALEGLSGIRDQQGIEAMVDHLNKELRKKTEKKRMYRPRPGLKQPHWAIIALVLILLLIIISYFVINRFLI